MGVGGGGGDGAAGVELVDEHGLDHEPEGHLGVLDGVHEERWGERGAVDGVAYFGFLILCYFPAIFLHNNNTKMAFKLQNNSLWGMAKFILKYVLQTIFFET